MIRVRMWGHLAEKYTNDPIELDVTSWAQLVGALDSIYPDFRKEFLAGKEYAFAIRRKSETGNPADEFEFLSEETLALPLDAEELHIIPKADGEIVEAAFSFAMWVGGMATAAGMSAAVIYTAMAVAFIGAAVALSMAVGAIVSMLGPKPPSGGSARADEAPSFVFNGAINITAPGYPIPIVYGECLTGSLVISVGVSAEEIPI